MDIAGRELIDSAVVCDLCACSGAVGLETLSWGASHCVFVDRNPRSTGLIRSFLKEHDAMDEATIITGDVRNYVKKINSLPDVVFIDPPYGSTDIFEWLDSVQWMGVLKSAGAVFVESGKNTIMLNGWKKRKYGDSYLHWKWMKEENDNYLSRYI